MATDSEKLELLNRLDRAMEAGKRMKEKIREESMVYVHAAESAASAGLIGYYEGRVGKETLVDGITLDFGVAAAAFAAAFFGLGPKYAPHAYAIGTGGLSIYTYKWGREMGQKMSQPAAPAATSGFLPPHQPGLTDAQIEQLASMGRRFA